MPFLTNLQTDLKSLRYGYDRRGAGPRETNASGQPYIVTPIPEGSINSGLGDEDFLLRGGSLLPGAIVRDVSRLTKMFFDLKSPNGFLFTLKQESLSRSSVNIKAVANGGLLNSQTANKLPLNNGLYLPTSTIAQAALNPLGGHLLKQGINPFAVTNTVSEGNILSPGFFGAAPLSNPIYRDTVAESERVHPELKGTSRLIDFLDDKINTNVDGRELYNYSGGPGSTLGVGKTRIQIAKDRTGINNSQLGGSADKTQQFFSTAVSNTGNTGFTPTYGIQPNGEYYDYNVFTRRSVTNMGAKIFNGKSLSQEYTRITGKDVLNGNFLTSNNTVALRNFSNNVFKPDSFDSNSPAVRGLDTTLDYQQLQDSISSHSDGGNINEYSAPEVKQDFRKKTKSGNSAKSIDYTGGKTLEGRVNLGNPGTKNISTNYKIGNNWTPLDKINAKALYKSEFVTGDDVKNDFVKFRIGVIDNDDPSLKTYIHFRALIDQMDDNYEAEWAAQKFMGRAENFYNYSGFNRTFNLSWTVVAQSKAELIPMYTKLNYLASVCGPSYSKNGYMRGNLITLTVGGYLYEQTGIMTGISYGVPEEAPWEIAIDTLGESDETVKELPHMIKVSGFSFKPIQHFVPSLQENMFGKLQTSTKGAMPVDGGTGDVVKFGPQRYIALNNSTNLEDSNYGASQEAHNKLLQQIATEAEEWEMEQETSENDALSDLIEAEMAAQENQSG